MYHFNFVPRAQRSSQERDCLCYPRGGEPCEGDFHPSRGAQWKHNCLLCVHLRKRPAGQEHQPWYHPKWPEHDDCCHRGSQRRKQLQYTGEEHTGMHLKALMLEKRMMKKAPKHQFKYVYLCLLHQTLNREEQKIRGTVRCNILCFISDSTASDQLSLCEIISHVYGYL